METAVLETAVPPPATGAPVSLRRRAATSAIDLGLLGAGLLWATFMEITIADAAEAQWLFLVWALFVAPLYFALYHAYGTGATPGQRELGVAMRRADGNVRLGLGASLVRAYTGLLVFPVLLDALGRVGRLTFRDRLTQSRALELETKAESPPIWSPTAAELRDIFEPERGGRALRRALRLGWQSRRQLVRSVLSVYLGLVALAAVVAPLFIEDFEADDLGSYESALWTVVAVVLFASGVYWKQAAVSTVIEAIRTGERIATAEVLRRAVRRVNALSAALVLLIAATLIFPGGVVLFPLVLARLIFFVPAIVIEDRHVLASFRRSAQLTSGKTGRMLARLVLSVLVVLTVVAVAGLLGIALSTGLFAGFGADLNPIGYAYAVAVGLALASIPVSLVMAVIGAYWALLHHDLRRSQAARS